MQMLQIILDEQATPQQREYFKIHMDRCMPCFKTYNVDATIKDLIKSKCCGGEAPQELIEGIKQKIGQQPLLLRIIIIFIVITSLDRLCYDINFLPLK